MSVEEIAEIDLEAFATGEDGEDGGDLGTDLLTAEMSSPPRELTVRSLKSYLRKAKEVSCSSFESVDIDRLGLLG